MVKITINGKNLHEIQMRLKGEDNKGFVCLSYPEHRINAEVRERELVLQVPPLLAIALYHEIFRKEKEISVKVKNKDLGRLNLKEIRYPDELHDDGLVEMIFERWGNMMLGGNKNVL